MSSFSIGFCIGIFIIMLILAFYVKSLMFKNKELRQIGSDQEKEIEALNFALQVSNNQIIKVTENINGLRVMAGGLLSSLDEFEKRELKSSLELSKEDIEILSARES